MAKNIKKKKSEKVITEFLTPVIISKVEGDHHDNQIISKIGDEENKYEKGDCDSIARAIKIVQDCTVNHPGQIASFTYDKYVNQIGDVEKLKTTITYRMQNIIRVSIKRITDNIFYNSLKKDDEISDYNFNIGPTSIIRVDDVIKEDSAYLHFKTSNDAQKILCLTNIEFHVIPNTGKINEKWVKKVDIVVGFILPHMNSHNIGFEKNNDEKEPISECDYWVHEVIAFNRNALVYTCQVEPFILIDKLDFYNKGNVYVNKFDYIEMTKGENKNLNYKRCLYRLTSKEIVVNENYHLNFLCDLSTDNTRVKDDEIESFDYSYDKGPDVYAIIDFIYKTINTAVIRLGYIDIDKKALDALTGKSED